jgi:8-hydroxy-5-deazaflavin:NADPH oxidoreductase
MKIGIIGAGHIGSNCARQFARVGHQVLLSYSRRPGSLSDLAAELGHGATATTAAVAAYESDITVLSVPWATIDDVISQVGSFQGRVVIDTTNQFAPSGTIDLGGRTAARHNATRLGGARYTKSFNTLTAGFQAANAGRIDDDRVVQWVCGDDVEAKQLVATLIDEIGYTPIDIGGLDDASVMEAPRRPGSVYGEEYRRLDAEAVVKAIRAGQPIPATPSY